MEIFRLFGSIFIENDKANQSIDSTDKKGQGLAKTFGGMVGAAVKVGAGIAAGVAVAGGAIYGLASKASEAAGEINDMAVRTGLTTTQLQELKYASQQVGVNFESITGASAKLNKTMADAANGSKKALDSFGKLGVSFKNSDGSLRNMSETFPEVIKKLANMKNESERNALAFQFFGKGATELVPLLAQGENGIEDLTKKAHELGLVMNEEAIAAGDNFGDTIDSLKSSFGAIGTQLGVAFLPILQKLADWLLSNMPAIQAVMKTVFDAISTVVTKAYIVFKDNILPILTALYDWVNQNMPTFRSIFESAFNAISSIVSSVWGLFKNSLLPILSSLYEFVKPKIPMIEKIIKSAFKGIAENVQLAVDVFSVLAGGIQTALDLLEQFNAEQNGNFSKGGGNGGGGGRVGAFANGTDSAPGGLALVGEQGPELINLPRGSKVYTNNETQGLLGGSPIIIQNMNVRNESDIKLIARELFNLQQQKNRGLGLV